jgi:hypothetical protein
MIRYSRRYFRVIDHLSSTVIAAFWVQRILFPLENRPHLFKESKFHPVPPVKKSCFGIHYLLFLFHAVIIASLMLLNKSIIRKSKYILGEGGKDGDPVYSDEDLPREVILLWW